jgi:chromosome segregation ATPase
LKKNEELHIKTALLADKDKEIEALKKRVNQLQEVHQQETEALKQQYDAMLQSRIEIELGEAKAAWNAEKAALEAQIKAATLDKEEVENNLKHAQSEIERLTNLLKEARDDLEKNKKKVRSLEQELQDTKNQDEETLRNTLEKETNTLRAQHDKERNSLEDYVKKLKIKIQDFENRIVLFMLEIDRLNSVVIEKDDEVDTWNQRLVDAARLHENQLNDLKRHFEHMLKNRLVGFPFYFHFLGNREPRSSSQI